MAGTPTPNLIFKTFDQFVSDESTGWGAALGLTPELLSGDPALAVFQTAATQFMFIEFLIQALILAMRLSTATDGDVDSFVADFGLTRLPATLATGVVVFGALTPPSTPIPIAAGSIVQTNGGAIQYQTAAAVTLQSGASSVIAPAVALVAGSASNVQAGQLNQFTSAIASVDTVTNPASIVNGKDAETDAELKAQFILFLQSLSKATRGAILFAINSVMQGLDIGLAENQTPDLGTQLGFFTAFIDAGLAPTNVEAESDGNTPASGNTAIFTLANTPVQPGSVEIEVAGGLVGTISDTNTGNGTGALADALGIASGTIVYATGQCTITLTVAFTSAEAITSSYNYFSPPPAGLFNQIFAAIDAVRAFTVQFAVSPPATITAVVALNIRVDPNGTETPTQAEATVALAIVNYVNSLTIGQSLYLLRLPQVAEDGDDNVISVQPGSVTINGQPADMAATQGQLIRTSIANVTVGSY